MSTQETSSTNILSQDTPTSDEYVDFNTAIGHHIPTIQYLTHSIQKTICPDNGIEYFQLTNLHHIQWKETTFEQYDKNTSYKVFTKPIPISTLPTDVDILRSILAPSVKPIDIQSIWKFGLRHCIKGKSLKGNEQYDPTFVPTVSSLFFHFQVCYSAANNFCDISGDFSNVFQYTYEPDISTRFFCYFPPFYLIWWNSRFPTTPIHQSGGMFGLKSYQNIQGTPHAANCWKKTSGVTPYKPSIPS